MASAASAVVLKRWTRMIEQWPMDRVRPEHVAFQKIMQRRLEKISPPTAAATVPPASPASSPLDEQNEMRQLAALDALLEDRFAKAYPVPAKLRYPASMPTHYDDVVKEMEEAPSRTWMASFMKRLKGSLRFS